MTTSVTATLHYFSNPTDGSRPYIHINVDPATGLRSQNWVPQEHPVQIENVRGHENSLNLDANGFQFVKSATQHSDFTNDDKIKEQYYPESVQLIKQVTGASRVVLFDHTVRRNRPDLPDTPENRHPVPRVHVDQTPASATARVHRHLPEEDVPGLLSRRFQILNLWRPISHPAYDFPLALCDYQSVDTDTDLVPVSLVYPDREGETFGVKFNENHKWKYQRGMNTDEVVLIKCYDSKQDEKTAVYTPHTGFQDPSTPQGSPFRESIELRALVFYD